MPVNVMIPTPLRPFVGKKSVIELKSRWRSAKFQRSLTTEFAASPQASLHRRRQNSQLRQRLRE